MDNPTVVLYKKKNNKDLKWSITLTGTDLLVEYGTSRQTISHQSEEEALKDFQRRVDYRLNRKGWSKKPQEEQQVRVMLAQDYDWHQEQLKEGYNPYEAVCASPKLDGVRAYWDGKNLLSRTQVPFTCLPHIVEALKSLPPGMYDGELYHPSLDLEEIVSACRVKVRNGISDLIQFHIFDIISPGTSYERLLKLGQINITHPLIRVPQTIIEIKDVQDQARLYVSQGYEGLVFKKFEEKYIYDERRMYRIKPIQKEKFIVTGVVDKPRSRGCAVLQFHEFEATINYNKDIQKFIFKNPDCIVGKAVTVEFRGFTKKGIPRNAKVVQIPMEYLWNSIQSSKKTSTDTGTTENG